MVSIFRHRQRLPILDSVTSSEDMSSSSQRQIEISIFLGSEKRHKAKPPPQCPKGVSREEIDLWVFPYIGQLTILNLLVFFISLCFLESSWVWDRLFYFRGCDDIVAAKNSSSLDVEIETKDHGRAGMLCASLFKKKHNARKAVWFTKATANWSNFCVFVDSIDSQIIRESKSWCGPAKLKDNEKLKLDK